MVATSSKVIVLVPEETLEEVVDGGVILFAMVPVKLSSPPAKQRSTEKRMVASGNKRMITVCKKRIVRDLRLFQVE